VADFAAYAEDKAGEVELVETTIPVAPGILAAPEPTAEPLKVYA
jgi:hypothetical protein